MNIKFAATAFVLASSLIGASSFAADPVMKNSEADAPTPLTKSDLSRAQVKADTRKALKEGSVPKVGEADAPTAATKSELTRAQVKADTRKALKEGTVPKVTETN